MKVVSFYRFTNVGDLAKLRENLQARCEEHNLLGTVLIAEEGVNGTLAGSDAAL